MLEGVMNVPDWLRGSLFVLAGAGFTAFVRSEPPRQTWEYFCGSYLHPIAGTRPTPQTIYDASRAEADSLNRVGARGWEMVGVGGSGAGVRYCFKRARP